jgi:hypothetical protein
LAENPRRVIRRRAETKPKLRLLLLRTGKDYFLETFEAHEGFDNIKNQCLRLT